MSDTLVGGMVKGFFIVWIIAIIVLCVAIGKGCNYVKAYGLKNTIERIWNGPTNTISPIAK